VAKWKGKVTEIDFAGDVSVFDHQESCCCNFFGSTESSYWNLSFSLPLDLMNKGLTAELSPAGNIIVPSTRAGAVARND